MKMKSLIAVLVVGFLFVMVNFPQATESGAGVSSVPGTSITSRTAGNPSGIADPNVMEQLEEIRRNVETSWREFAKDANIVIENLVLNADVNADIVQMFLEHMQKMRTYSEKERQVLALVTETILIKERERQEHERKLRDKRIHGGINNLWVLDETMEANHLRDVVTGAYRGDVLEIPVYLARDPNQAMFIVLEGEAFRSKAVHIVTRLYTGEYYLHIRIPTLADVRTERDPSHLNQFPVCWGIPHPDGYRRCVIDDPEFIDAVQRTNFKVTGRPEDKTVDLSRDGIPEVYNPTIY